MKDEVFWLVWCDERRAPTYKHNDRRSAELESHRLAKTNPGQRFYVLQVVGFHQTEDPVKWVELGLPF